ncbi:hypothetical protein COCOR_05776 [Corallococcus coralloides DSM 2259]|uniref:Uncharacterized protein n=1 Tax=Corallococcus coralloides (strain ATCC 25202 / DSM 2259 / NBRC 100086 / M2) TaxID=1144275 RepID=H8MGU3_CORCM|nr:hypothetical protein COCOR_05776 [Corallococcus coralloides DSM 2259]
MPKFAEFEEKEFEGPLNAQMGLGAPMWSPGQVLEKVVGFDVALMVQGTALWAQQGFAVPPQGAVILPAWWPWGIARLAVKVRRPPPFRLNLFLQYKRPEYLRGAQAGEWSKWKRSYYRFWIENHQQRALDACTKALGADGLVAYASPAFHSRVDLFRHVEARTLQANTHFAPASRLTGHGRYTYVDAVTPGKAHSKVVEVEPLRFLSGGDRDAPPRAPPGGGDGDVPPRAPPGGGDGDAPPRAPPGGGDDGQPIKLLAAARRAADAAITSSPQIVGSGALLRTTVQRAIESLRAGPVPVPEAYEQPVQDFIFAATFSWMSGIGWAVI